MQIVASGWHADLWGSISTSMTCLAAGACTPAVCTWPSSGRALCACLTCYQRAVWACSPSVYALHLSASQWLMLRMLGLYRVLLLERTCPHSN